MLIDPPFSPTPPPTPRQTHTLKSARERIWGQLLGLVTEATKGLLGGAALYNKHACS